MKLFRYLKSEPQAPAFRQKQTVIAHAVEDENDDDAQEDDNQYEGIIVNGKKLTPEEAKKFIKSFKKVINVTMGIIGFFSVLAMISGAVIGSIITLAVLFILRQALFNWLDKSVETTVKEYAKNPTQFQEKEPETGWMGPNGKRATPEDLKKGAIIIGVFIIVCFSVFFSEGNIPALIAGLVLIGVLRSMLKQIKEDTNATDTKKS